MPPGALVTVPVPLPPLVTVSVCVGVAAVNVAVTERAWSIVTVQPPVPLQAPLQPAKVLPAAADCDRVTPVPWAKASLQSAPQLMPRRRARDGARAGAGLRDRQRLRGGPAADLGQPEVVEEQRARVADADARHHRGGAAGQRRQVDAELRPARGRRQRGVDARRLPAPRPPERTRLDDADLALGAVPAGEAEAIAAGEPGTAQPPRSGEATSSW